MPLLPDGKFAASDVALLDLSLKLSIGCGAGTPDGSAVSDYCVGLAQSRSDLIIYDHPSMRMLLRGVLEEAGYRVWEAANGREGMDFFGAHPVDLVITDLASSETTGLELILELMRTFLHVTVIAITGESSKGLNKAALLGARQTFHKPFDLEALLQAVDYDLHH